MIKLSFFLSKIAFLVALIQNAISVPSCDSLIHQFNERINECRRLYDIVENHDLPLQSRREAYQKWEENVEVLTHINESYEEYSCPPREPEMLPTPTRP